MNLKTRSSLKRRCGASTRWLAAFALAATAAAYRARPDARAVTAEPTAAQDVIGLERRISIVEQRLNSIELSVNRLEQQSRLPSSAPPPTRSVRDTELELLRSEVELLQRRVAEDECGLVRVDERTLTQSVREERRKNAAGREDPCRLNADAPLRLSSRQ
jgi:hypothetical protein